MADTGREQTCPDGDRPCETDDERNVREYGWLDVDPRTQDGWLCWMCAEPVKR